MWYDLGGTARLPEYVTVALRGPKNGKTATAGERRRLVLSLSDGLTTRLKLEEGSLARVMMDPARRAIGLGLQAKHDGSGRRLYSLVRPRRGALEVAVSVDTPADLAPRAERMRFWLEDDGLLLAVVMPDWVAGLPWAQQPPSEPSYEMEPPTAPQPLNIPITVSATMPDVVALVVGANNTVAKITNLAAPGSQADHQHVHPAAQGWEGQYSHGDLAGWSNAHHLTSCPLSNMHCAHHHPAPLAVTMHGHALPQPVENTHGHAVAEPPVSSQPAPIGRMLPPVHAYEVVGGYGLMLRVLPEPRHLIGLRCRFLGELPDQEMVVLDRAGFALEAWRYVGPDVEPLTHAEAVELAGLVRAADAAAVAVQAAPEAERTVTNWRQPAERLPEPVELVELEPVPPAAPEPSALEALQETTTQAMAEALSPTMQVPEELAPFIAGPLGQAYMPPVSSQPEPAAHWVRQEITPEMGLVVPVQSLEAMVEAIPQFVLALGTPGGAREQVAEFLRSRPFTDLAEAEEAAEKLLRDMTVELGGMFSVHREDNVLVASPKPRRRPSLDAPEAVAEPALSSQEHRRLRASEVKPEAILLTIHDQCSQPEGEPVALMNVVQDGEVRTVVADEPAAVAEELQRARLVVVRRERDGSFTELAEVEADAGTPLDQAAELLRASIAAQAGPAFNVLAEGAYVVIGARDPSKAAVMKPEQPGRMPRVLETQAAGFVVETHLDLQRSAPAAEPVEPVEPVVEELLQAPDVMEELLQAFAPASVSPAELLGPAALLQREGAQAIAVCESALADLAQPVEGATSHMPLAQEATATATATAPAEEVKPAKAAPAAKLGAMATAAKARAEEAARRARVRANEEAIAKEVDDRLIAGERVDMVVAETGADWEAVSRRAGELRRKGLRK